MAPIRSLLALLLLLGALATHAEEKSPVDFLRGPAFIPHQKYADMPDGWEQKPITYTNTYAGSDLLINLDQQFHPFLAPFISEFTNKKGWKVPVIEGTCGTAEGMLRKRNLDIGGFCCPPAPSDRLPGMKFHTLGLQSLAIIVNATNPMDNLSIEDVRRIFQNKVKNWNELKTSQGTPGPDLPVRPIIRTHCDVRPGHWKLILKSKDDFGPRATDVGSIDDLLVSVAGNPGAIGYEEMPTARRFDKSGGKIKALHINGVGPDDAQALADGRYPIYQIYNLTTWESDPASNAKAKELVEYLKTRMDTVDPSSHFVPSELLRKQGWKFTDQELTGEPG